MFMEIISDECQIKILLPTTRGANKSDAIANFWSSI